MLAVRPPVAPMLAKLTRELPGPGFVYEPKWDGFRALAFVEGGTVDLRSRNDKKLARYFPEVAAPLGALGVDAAIDGELVVVAERGLDFASLMQRLHPAATRVRELSAKTPAAFVAFDLLAIGAEDLRARPFAERRARLLELCARSTSPHLMVTPATDSLERAATWLERFTGRGLDGVVAKHPGLAYSPGKRAMIKIKRARTADCIVAGVRLLEDGRGIGSLLLGLYDDRDALVHIGVASQLTAAARKEMLELLRPLATRIEGHPWEDGFHLAPSPLGRLPGSAGRWSPDEMERDWVPIRAEKVCEVTYDVVDAGRLRYPARFVRWRPDRDPPSCRFEQLEEEDAIDVNALLAAS
jgi:ATP-dependent DNA ligase